MLLIPVRAHALEQVFDALELVADELLHSKLKLEPQDDRFGLKRVLFLAIEVPG
jgi:hypothetical protein